CSMRSLGLLLIIACTLFSALSLHDALPISFAAAVEAFEHGLADGGILEVLDDGAGVVELFAGHDEQDGVVGVDGVVQVRALAGVPVGAGGGRVGLGGAGFGGGVGAGDDDVDHGLVEQRADHAFVGRAAVFDGVVEQAGDGLVFVAAVFDHQRRDAEHVAQVRDQRALAHLAGVGDAGVVDGPAE